jgi:ribose transport system permease protein
VRLTSPASAEAWRGRAALWAYVPLGLIAGAASVLAPSFRSLTNLENLVSQFTPLLLLSLGQTLVIAAGGLDLSGGSVISLVTVIASFVVADVAHIPLGVAICLGAALLVGSINGMAISRLGIHPFMMTLGSLTVVQGVALLLRPSPGGTIPPAFGWIVSGSVGGVPVPVLWAGAATGGACWLLRRARYGLHVFAVGGSAEHAYLSGVNVRRTQFLTYLLFACGAGLAGVYMTGRILSGDPLIGQSFGLDSITAAVLGGTPLGGGRASVGGTVAGVVILAVLGNLLTLLNVSPFYQYVLRGGLLIAAIGLSRSQGAVAWTRG